MLCGSLSELFFIIFISFFDEVSISDQVHVNPCGNEFLLFLFLFLMKYHRNPNWRKEIVSGTVC